MTRITGLKSKCISRKSSLKTWLKTWLKTLLNFFALGTLCSKAKHLTPFEHVLRLEFSSDNPAFRLLLVTEIYNGQSLI